MNYRELHAWNVAVTEAIAIQNRLRAQVVAEGDPGEVRLVAGIDVGLRGAVMLSAVVVLAYPGFEVVERAVAEAPATFPYVPGLLSFREAPAVLAAVKKLTHAPDLVFVDGQGLAHPRRLGIASHIGLLIDRPTIGCAKSILVGRHEALGPNPGERAALIHDGEVVGYALRTRPGVKPVYVSVGHRIGLEAAAAWTLRCCRGFRLPEPTRQAHTLASG